MFYLICAWINGCANNREAGDLWRHRDHYDVTVSIDVLLILSNNIFAIAALRVALCDMQPKYSKRQSYKDQYRHTFNQGLFNWQASTVYI